MFGRDFTSYMAFSPIILILGIVFVCFYIVMLVVNLEFKAIHTADRYDLVYKVVFSVTFIMLVIRSWLGDFMGDGTELNVPIAITIMAMASGLITWFTPKIKDNNNSDF